jgi:hypothetical protein
MMIMPVPMIHVMKENASLLIKFATTIMLVLGINAVLKMDVIL